MAVVGALRKMSSRCPASMAEIKELVPWLLEHKIRLEVVYIRSEANLADAPSRQRVDDMWSLHLPTHQELLLELGRVNIGLASLHRPLRRQAEHGCSKICHTSALSSQCSLQRLVPRLVSTRHALAQPAMSFTASQVLEKLRASRARGILAYPYWSLQPWFRSAAAVLLALQPATSTSLRQIAPPRPRRALRQSRGASAGSGLRLCVKAYLLQAGVLLATQGATPRMRA
jgi:hypothetical protein